MAFTAEENRSVIEQLCRQQAATYGIKDVDGFVTAMLAIAGAESSWRDDAVHDKGKGFGLYGLHDGGYAGDLTKEERLDPYYNTLAAIQQLAPLYAQTEGQGFQAALRRMTGPMGQNPKDPEALFRNSIQHATALGNIGALPTTEPITAAGVGGSVLDEPDPDDEKYKHTAASILAQGLGEESIGTPNRALYLADMNAWRTATTGEPGTELIDYMDTALDRWATLIAGGQLDVAKADIELSKRIGALTEAGKTYRELAPYALPEGSKWIPGGEPGGLYEQMGIGTIPATLTRVDPYATVMAMMGKTPEMGAVPEMTPEALLAEAQRLQGAAAPAAPSHLESALATAAAPTTTAEPAPAGVPIRAPTPEEERLQMSIAPVEEMMTPAPPVEGVDVEDEIRVIEIIEKVLGVDLSHIKETLGRSLPVRGAKAWWEALNP